MIRSLLTTLFTAAALATAPLTTASAAHSEPEFLPVHEAFKISATETPDAVMVHIAAAPGYYLYKSKLGFQIEGNNVHPGQAVLPAGEEKNDPYFGDVVIYHDSVDARLPIRNAGHLPFTLKVGFQGCAEKGLCYPPDSQSIQIGSGAGTAGVGGWSWISIALSLLAGLALSVSPIALTIWPVCFLVMMRAPAAGRSRQACVSLFGLTMAAGYTIILTASGHLGSHYNVIAKLQSAWALFPTIGILWIAAARAMSSNVQSKKVALLTSSTLGFLASIVIAPWVTSPVAKTMTSIAAGGSWIGGSLQIFALATGLAIPMIAASLLLARLFAGRVKILEAIGQAAAVLVAVVGIWVAGRIIPDQAALALTGFLAIYVATRMSVLSLSFKRATACRSGVGIVLLLYGLIGWVGALKGESDPINPLGISWTSIAHTDPLRWTSVSSAKQLAGALYEAKTAGKPAVVEWSAKWCVGCGMIDRLWQSSNVKSPDLRKAMFIKVNVTDDNQQVRDLMELNGQFGLPSLQFYRPDGSEVVDQRVTGLAAETALEHSIEQALN